MGKERHLIRKANSTACIKISFNIYVMTHIFCERIYIKVLRVLTSGGKNMIFL